MHQKRINIKLGRDRAKLSAEVTHNHPEGVKGALAVTDAIIISRFYAGGYGDDMGNPINERFTLEQYKIMSCKSLDFRHFSDLDSLTGFSA